MLLKCFSASRVFLLKSSNTSLEYVCRRSLIPERNLGLEKFTEESRNKKRIVDTYGEETFYRRLEYLEKRNLVNLSDLKCAAFVAEEEDMVLLKQMFKRYVEKRTKELFRLGPVIMKRLHQLNLPDVAIEFFSDETLTHQFAYYVSACVYIDLLFENQRYEEIVRAFEKLVELDPVKLMGRPLISAYFISLYKISSPEAFEKADKVWKEYRERVSVHMRRTIQAYAAIQLKKMKPDNALKVLTVLEPIQDELTINIWLQAHIAQDNWLAVKDVLENTNRSLLSETWYMIIQKNREAQFEKQVEERIKGSTVGEELCLPL